MASFDWKDEYSMGIASIDAQHKRLIGLINEIQECMGTGGDARAIQAVLHELENYAVYHFSQEEIIFQEYGYKKTKEHGKAHELFMKNIERLRRAMLRDAKDAPSMAATFLQDWLEDHIMKDDAEYRNFIAKKDMKRD